MIAAKTMLRPGVWAATWGHDDGDDDDGDGDDGDGEKEDNGKMAATVVDCHLVEELFSFLLPSPPLCPASSTETCGKSS